MARPSGVVYADEYRKHQDDERPWKIGCLILGVLLVVVSFVALSNTRPSPDCEYDQHAHYTTDGKWACEDVKVKR